MSTATNGRAREHRVRDWMIARHRRDILDRDDERAEKGGQR